MSGIHEPENPREWIARVRVRLALRCAEKPATKAGQIKALWPEIEAALDKGQSMKTIPNCWTRKPVSDSASRA